MREEPQVAGNGRQAVVLAVLVLIGALGVSGQPLAAEEPQNEPKRVVREIFVPFENLDVLLENQPRRVMLSRKEYEELLERAKKAPTTHAPQSALLLSADYGVTVQKERAEIAGTLAIEVLEEGLHAVGMELSGVGLRSAILDGKAAALGQADDGRWTLFVEGKGVHELNLQMVLPLETTAAQQVLHYRLPRPPAATMRLTVPGDVEVKSGADVASRVVDEKAGVTRFELVPASGESNLVMTLNSHLARRQRAVAARSVLVDEVTEAYERLHATVSFEILHQAVDGFRFVVPEGFEVTDVSTPLLARWAVTAEGPRRLLDVRLREQTTERVVLNLSALRTGAASDPWKLAQFTPLDVVGQVAVVGLLVDQRLKAEAIDQSGLIPIDTAVLRQAIPETVFREEPGAPSLRPVVAYYAPQARFSLSARFTRPAAEVSVKTSVLVEVQEKGLEARGGFVLTPEVEKLFGFDFSLPAGWQVTAVTAPDGKALAYESFTTADAPGRVRVTLPGGVAPGQLYRVNFQAVCTPTGWIAEGTARTELPVFHVLGATRDQGAVALHAAEDLTVRPETVERLTPLDEAEKALYCLGNVATSLAYRYDGVPYRATFSIQRTAPRLTARTYSFLRILPDAVDAHYEITYQVEEARARQVSLLLPATTPAALSIRGMDQVKLKEFGSEPAGAMRRWKVLLEQPLGEKIRLAVDFQQPLGNDATQGEVLPLIAADGVAYQSGLVSVEGNPEIEVRIATKARRVDVGELVEAEYQPGRNLLGAFGFVGDPPVVKADVFRHPGYRLHPTIAQKAELTTFVSTAGVSQTAASFQLRTKALFLEVQLPSGASLWSADLDGQPIKPQREKKSLLLSLPATAAETVRTLRIVYQAPVSPVALAGRMNMPAPKLLLRADRGAQAAEVPLADLAWHLYLPTGYQVIRADGTVVTQIDPPEPAVLSAVKAGLALVFCPNPMFVLGGCAAPKSARPYSMGDDVKYAEPAGEAMPAEAPAAEQPAEEPQVAADESKPAKADVTLESAARPSRKPISGEKPLEEALKAGEDKSGVSQMDRELRDQDDPFGERTMDRMEKAEKKLEEKLAERDSGRPIDGQLSVPKAPVPAPAVPQRPTTPPAKAAWGLASQLEGFNSLKIDLDQNPDSDVSAVTFQSLGVDPQLAVTLVHRPRLDNLGWGLALAVGLAGLALTRRPARLKVRFVLAVLVVATLLPLVPGLEFLLAPANMAVYAAALLIPYYLLVGALGQVAALVHSFWRRPRTAAPVATSLLVVLAASLSYAAEPDSKSGPYVIQVVEPSPPVTVPEDALILPYDPASETGIRDADRLLVPFEKYKELWNRAYPDKPLDARRPPADYALAGASYTTRLTGDEYLVLDGQWEIDVYADQYVSVPLGLRGGVLARADLDGKPARLSVAGYASENPPQVPGQQAANSSPRQTLSPSHSLLLLHVSGKGRHRLDVTVRLRLERRGGWRVVEGTLPYAPASSLSITVPDAKTEVRLGQVLDRSNYETEKPDEEIRTALGPRGTLSLQWRPKVAEGQVDRSLTARSTAVLDVQEDSLALTWLLNLEFPRSQRDGFTVQAPKEYLVEKVEGGNVRGWDTKPAATHQTVTVSLLKTAKDSDSLTVRLRRTGAVGQADLAEFDVPVVTIPDAALHNGEVTIRRSPLLEVRSVTTSGVARTDLGVASSVEKAAPGSEESPLGLRPYQAYRFVSMPFAIRLAAAPRAGRVAADVQTIVRVAEYERTLESRVNLSVEDRPIYAVRILLPEELKLDNVSAPGEYNWALTRPANRPLLTVYLAAGQQGRVQLVLSGSLGRVQATAPASLPNLEVVDVQRQQGDIAVLADPAFNVQAKALENCESVLLHRVNAWLNPDQQRLARLAVHYRASDYRGEFQLAPRQPIVACDTTSNVRITDRAVEETVLLNFTIEQAGIRRVEFLLPAWMKDSRISVPMLRQKTVEPVADKPGAPLRVRLELQDEVMDQLRVLVVNDRLLTAQLQTAPIPVVRTGRTDRQFVALESAGRDEVVVEKAEGLEVLTRQQREWGKLTSILGTNITQAYLVSAGATEPRLVFKTHERAAVETSGARIGLAETNLVFDSSGAYRAEQTYRLDNTTEQFLELQLPAGADLWTARVAGQPVKPTQVPGGKQPGRARIPLVKTAPGDLDYPVVLKYGGKLAALGSLNSVDFPLIHTVNINVELSQVRLYLPETHQWYDFDGTLGRVADEQDLRAGYYSYQTKQTERLLKTMQSGDQFAQVRAANSLKQMGANLRQLGVAIQRGSQAESLQKEFQKNDEVLRQAEQQVLQFENAPADQRAVDNRARLEDLYQGQRTSRAKNVVQDLDYNFDQTVAAPSQDLAQKGLQLNKKWLEQNKLGHEAEAAQLQDKSQRVVEDYKGYKGRAGGGKSKANVPPTSMPSMEPTNQPMPNMPGMAPGDQFKPEDRSAGQPSAPQGPPGQMLNRRADSQRDLVNRYQQEHMQQQQAAQVAEDSQLYFDRTGQPAQASQSVVNGMPQAGGQGVVVMGPGGAPGGPVGGRVMGGTGIAQAEGGDMGAALAQHALPAGLASLDVQLPLRGVAYRFSTPQGDIAITARAASQRLIVTSEQVSAVLGLALLAMVLIYLVRQGRFAWLASRVSGALMLVSGLVLFCLFPVLGLVGLLGGMTVLARQARIRGSKAVEA
jgi:hypothetical protein